VIDATGHDDVVALRLTWWRSRLIGFAVHAYVVRGVLIDTGFPAVERDVVAYARDHAIRGAIVTHQHEDHAGNVDALAQAGIPLAIDARTLHVVAHDHPIGLYRHFTWRAMRPLRPTFDAFADDSLELLHTPGHSDDHHVVWDRRTDTLFAGDLFLGVKVRVAHPYEDPRRQVQSLRDMLARRPARVFCAHRGLVPGGVRALEAKADWMDATIAAIDALARSGATASEIRTRALGPRGWIHWTSAGDYSPDNFVRAVLRGTATHAGSVTTARNGATIR
jgi:glyoxylase-like metal-dependent hydrolase (beta-lactamase superfamily II)